MATTLTVGSIIAKSLHCIPEANIILYICYTQFKILKFLLLHYTMSIQSEKSRGSSAKCVEKSLEAAIALDYVQDIFYFNRKGVGSLTQSVTASQVLPLSLVLTLSMCAFGQKATCWRVTQSDKVCKFSLECKDYSHWIRLIK